MMTANKMGQSERPTPFHPQTQDRGWASLAAVPPPLAGRTLLYLAAMETTRTDSLGVLRDQLPRVVQLACIGSYEDMSIRVLLEAVLFNEFRSGEKDGAFFLGLSCLPRHAGSR